MEILFFQEDVNIQWSHEELIRQWIIRTIRSERGDVEIGIINIVFCTDEYLLDINIQYLDHNYYTDIVTFPYAESPLTADLYISTDRVKENAEERSIGFNHELNRVVIHGILHVCGYTDKTEEEEIKMREREDHYLALLPIVKDGTVSQP